MDASKDTGAGLNRNEFRKLSVGNGIFCMPNPTSAVNSADRINRI
jgi:hypothetical protein